MMNRSRIFATGVFFSLLLVSFAAAPALDLPETANLRLWLKADAGVTADGSSRVSQWNDQLTGGNTVAQNASQTTPGSQPLFVPGALGGKPVLRFDGPDNLLGPSGVLILNSGGTAPRTVFVVGNSTAAGNHEMFDLHRTFQSGVTSLFRITPELGMRQGNGNRLWANDTVGATHAVVAVQTPGPPNNNTVNTTGYKNSAIALTPTATGNPTGAMNTGSDGYTMGAAGFAGDIAEILVYESALSVNQIDAVGTYLAAKYDVVGAFTEEVYWDNGSTDTTGAVDPPYPGDNLWSTASNWRVNNTDPMNQFPNDTLPGPRDRVNISLHNTPSEPAANTVPANVEAGDDLLVNSVRVGGNFGLGVGGDGILNINGGTLTIADNGGTGAGGRLEIAGTGDRSGVVHVNGGTLNVGLDVVIGANRGSGTSTLTVDGGTLNVGGSSITVDMFNVGHNAGANATFTLASGQTLSTVRERVMVGEAGTGEFIQEASSTVNVGTGSAQNLVVGGNAGTGDGTYTMQGGQVNVSQDLNIGNITTGLFEQQDGEVNITRDIQLAAGTAGSGDGTYLLEGGTLDVGRHIRVGKTLNGVGLFTQSGGSATLGDDLLITEDASATGTYQLQDGTLDLQGNNVVFGPGTAAFELAGGTLKDVNNFGAALNQQGGLLAAGGSPDLMTIGGDYTLGAAGILEVEMNGDDQGDLTTPDGVGYDWYDVDFTGGVAGLVGTIRVDLQDGFSPLWGQTFDVLSADTITPAAEDMTFEFLVDGAPFGRRMFGASIEGAAGSGQVLRLSYLVPEPAMLLVWSLLTAGGLALGRRRRRW